MHISLSTVTMAILTASVLLTFVYICLVNKTILIRVGYKLLALSVFVTVLRFALPIEFPFTRNVSLPRLLSDLAYICCRRLFLIGEQPISLWLVFECIWVIGAIISIALEIIKYFRFRYHIILFGKELTKTSPYQEIVQQVCEETHHANHFRVIELPGLKTPTIFGLFFPKILIPEHVRLDEVQTYYILRHEMTHHFHHDILIKCLVRLLTSIYWWYRPCRRLNHQAEVVLEMHVDDALTTSEPNFSSEYMHCLLEYKSSIIPNAVSIPTSFTMGLLPAERDDIVKRFYMLTNNQKKTNPLFSIVICSIVLCIYLGSYAFILEGYVSPTQNDYLYSDTPEYYDIPVTTNTFFTDENYIIDNLNGTYDFYLSGKYWMTLNHIDDSNNDVPIYTRDTCPYPLDQ